MRPRPIAMGFAMLAALAAGCAGPPPDAYVSGAPGAHLGLGLGPDRTGERCSLDGNAVFCGTWQKPSGTIRALGPAAGATLASLASASAWRSELDERFACGAPSPTTILGSVPAIELSCTRRVGGWPQVALVAVVDGQAYAADGILPTETVLERAVGIRSGRLHPEAAPLLPPGQAEGLIAARLAAEPFGAGDIGRYDELIAAGQRANLNESYPAAEQAYRAALEIQEKALGAGNPATAVAMMHVALQLADQGREPEADALFARAARLAPRAPNPTTPARLDHYRGLALLDADHAAAALAMLERAERTYAALLPPAMLDPGPAPASGGPFGTRAGAGGELPMDPETQAALIGVIETRRYQAICLRTLGRDAEARARIRSAIRLADAEGLHQQNLTARLRRTEAGIDDQLTPGSGGADLAAASRDFALAQPGSRPVAQTDLLRAADALASGDTGRALALCGEGADLLRELKVGTEPSLVAPCLAAGWRAAAADPGRRQALLAAMFETSQLAQGSVTSRQIALAAARLAAGARDPRVAAAIRRQQDAGLALAAAEQARDQRQADAYGGAPGQPDPAALGQRVEAARAALNDADAVLEAAAPNYGQLVSEAVGARDIFAELTPGEAFVSLVLDPSGGWVFGLRDGQIEAAPLPAGTVALAALVRRVRESVEPAADGALPAFDVADARTLYDDTLAPVAPVLAGARALVVAPAGPLLSVPFGILLTGPADPGALAAAPFLIRRFPISHVPAPANFVSLRRASGQAQAGTPWFGFGDFRPVTLRQATATFPSGACADSARLFAGLPPLPYAAKELDAARALLGGSASDQLRGVDFTRDRVLHASLGRVRVLHFATHALLPTDLACEPEPSIVTSAPAGAANASGALLTATDITGMRLDADMVILSACNSAGPDGSSAGESLSGLARAFFYAGARAVMVTHWSVNDQATAYVVAQTLARLRRGDPNGLAGALQGAELALLAGAGHGMPASLAHPFFWAPFAVVGEGRGRTVGAGNGFRTVAGL